MKGFFLYFHLSFFGYNQVHFRAFWYFNKYKILLRTKRWLVRATNMLASKRSLTSSDSVWSIVRLPNDTYRDVIDIVLASPFFLSDTCGLRVFNLASTTFSIFFISPSWSQYPTFWIFKSTLKFVFLSNLIFVFLIIVLKLGPVRWVTQDSADPGLEPGIVYKKIKEVKNPADSMTQQDPVVTRWLFIFFNQNNIVLIYKKNWGWPGQNPWPESRARFKSTVLILVCFIWNN